MEQQNNGSMAKGIVIGLLAGSAIGAVIALLYAPKSGKELRADIRQKTDDLIDGAEDYLHAAKQRAGEIVIEAKRRSEELMAEAKKKAETLLQDADRVIHDAQRKIEPIVEEGQRVKEAFDAGVEAYKEEKRQEKRQDKRPQA